MLDTVSKDQDEKSADAAGAGRAMPSVARTGEAPAKPETPRPETPKLSDAGAEAPVATPAAPKKGGRKKFVLALILLAAIAGGAYYGHYYWTVGRFLVSTDDAYVGADMAVISPKIQGYVATVPVDENDLVKAGEPIAVIDDGDYRLALESAEAKIATQHASVQRIASQRDAAEAQIGEAEATRNAASVDLAQAELDLSRATDLVKSGAGTKAQRDNAQSARDSAAAKVAGGEASIATATANVAVLDAEGKEAERTIRELEIARDKAARDLSFTVLRAPYDGVVGNLSVQPGDLVSAGRRLAAIVPMTKVYIDANFKETQLAEIIPGQKVEIEIDAMPGRKLGGTVVSLSPASGSVFSLLPSDNATGNFTKVVQRIPVRIEIDDAADLAGKLRPGLSAVVAIDIRTGPAALRSAEAAASSPAPGAAETSEASAPAK